MIKIGKFVAFLALAKPFIFTNAILEWALGGSGLFHSVFKNLPASMARNGI